MGVQTSAHAIPCLSLIIYIKNRWPLRPIKELSEKAPYHLDFFGIFRWIRTCSRGEGESWYQESKREREGTRQAPKRVSMRFGREIE
jgi:hypothetical protein